MHDMDFSTNQGTAWSVLKKVGADQEELKEELKADIDANFQKLFGMIEFNAVMSLFNIGDQQVDSMIKLLEDPELKPPKNWEPESDEVKGWEDQKLKMLRTLKATRNLRKTRKR